MIAENSFIVKLFLPCSDKFIEVKFKFSAIVGCDIFFIYLVYCNINRWKCIIITKNTVTIPNQFVTLFQIKYLKRSRFKGAKLPQCESSCRIADKRKVNLFIIFMAVAAHNFDVIFLKYIILVSAYNIYSSSSSSYYMDLQRVQTAVHTHIYTQNKRTKFYESSYINKSLLRPRRWTHLWNVHYMFQPYIRVCTTCIKSANIASTRTRRSTNAKHYADIKSHAGI